MVARAYVAFIAIGVVLLVIPLSTVLTRRARAKRRNAAAVTHTTSPRTAYDYNPPTASTTPPPSVTPCPPGVVLPGTVLINHVIPGHYVNGTFSEVPAIRLEDTSALFYESEPPQPPQSSSQPPSQPPLSPQSPFDNASWRSSLTTVIVPVPEPDWVTGGSGAGDAARALYGEAHYEPRPLKKDASEGEDSSEALTNSS